MGLGYPSSALLVGDGLGTPFLVEVEIVVPIPIMSIPRMGGVNTSKRSYKIPVTDLNITIRVKDEQGSILALKKYVIDSEETILSVVAQIETLKSQSQNIQIKVVQQEVKKEELQVKTLYTPFCKSLQIKSS